jgi:hypothetical protein
LKGLSFRLLQHKLFENGRFFEIVICWGFDLLYDLFLFLYYGNAFCHFFSFNWRRWRSSFGPGFIFLLFSFNVFALKH